VSCLLVGLLSAFSVSADGLPLWFLSYRNPSAMFVGLGMAEIVSAIPTSGGPYFWAAILAPKEKAAFASWITGWLVFDYDGDLEIPLTV